MTVELRQLIDAAIVTIREHADHLTELDQAIGDGDHGINMRRGFDAIADIADELGEMTPPAALQKIGMTLVMKVGGAAGPLYGSFFMSMGKALPEQPKLEDIANAFGEGVAAIKKRGKSDVGEKTMLDVLVPVHNAFANNLSNPEILSLLIATAESNLEATKDIQATKGRASFLGERSVGHLDPGAASSCLLIKVLCGCFENTGNSA